LNNLEGKKVLLTGGSRGIGPIIAESLVNKGASVAIAARSSIIMQDLASRLNNTGFKVIVVPVDLRDSSQRERLGTDALK
jgi:short-subunit dehydrogenase